MAFVPSSLIAKIASHFGPGILEIMLDEYSPEEQVEIRKLATILNALLPRPTLHLVEPGTTGRFIHLSQVPGKYPKMEALLGSGDVLPGYYCLHCAYRYTDTELLLSRERLETSVCPCGNSYLNGTNTKTGNKGLKDVCIVPTEDGRYPTC